MSFLIAVVCIVFGGVMERLKGAGAIGLWRVPVMIIYPAFLGLITGITDWRALLLIVVGYTIGESQAHGHITGAAIHVKDPTRKLDPNNHYWWQVGSLKTDLFWSIIIRGLIAGVPVLGAMFYDNKAWIVATAVSLAWMLSRACGPLLDHHPVIWKGYTLIEERKPQWDKMEVICGCLSVAIIFIILI